MTYFLIYSYENMVEYDNPMRIIIDSQPLAEPRQGLGTLKCIVLDHVYSDITSVYVGLS